MDWQELRTLADDPLCTIGAHTVHHYELAKLDADQARAEMQQSADVLQAQFGQRPSHISYPIGGPASAGQRNSTWRVNWALSAASPRVRAGSMPTTRKACMPCRASRSTVTSSLPAMSMYLRPE
ncbi:polysaccharide deacetylase family protein [Devosia sp. A8/3-2]|nr:polysaccharide deacetylase family protein [Devosia sp. A8/3-2]